MVGKGWAVVGLAVASILVGVVASSETLFDFLSEAPKAGWYNDRDVRLPFPGRNNDSRGFALILNSAVLEDGKTYTNVLEMHPRWQTDGMIEGRYSLAIPENAQFEAVVGLIHGAPGTDGVTFEVVWQGRTLSQVHDIYDGRLKVIQVDLSPYADQRGEFILRVKAGSSSARDWAVWQRARIVGIRPVVQAIPRSAVTGVTVTVKPIPHGPCPKNVTFSATITTNGPCTVTYVWERSDGGTSPPQEVTFAASGPKTVTTGWPREASGSYWVRVRTLSPNEVVSNQANFTLTCEVPLFARIVLDSLYCAKESKWDHGTNSDEPYLLVTSYASHRSPNSRSSGDPQVFGEVDSLENRRFDYTRKQRTVFEGEVPPGAAVGFSAVAMEADEGTSGQRRQMASELAEQISRALTDLPGVHVDPITRAITDLVTGNIFSLIDRLMYGLGGGADDHVANGAVILSYDQLRRWAQEGPHRPEVMDLDGGESGHYFLRWHIEFDRDASRSFAANFTHWDGFGVGDVAGTPEPEIVIAIDEDAPGDDGKFYIYNRYGHLVTHWNAFYTHYDRLAIGDVLGDARPEVVVASDDGGGQIRIYDGAGNRLRHFAAPFTKYDGLAMGNVMGDGKAEILIARDDDCQVFIYNQNGAKLRAFMVDWDFNGCRYTADAESNRHDGFAIGDVLGDGYAEIVMAKNRDGDASTVYVYDAYGQELRRFTRFFTNHDGFILANVIGDEKEDILIAVDGGDDLAGYALYIHDVQTLHTSTRFWPLFTEYDGLAAGDWGGDGKDEIVIATDEEDRVYVGM